MHHDYRDHSKGRKEGRKCAPAQGPIKERGRAIETGQWRSMSTSMRKALLPR